MGIGKLFGMAFGASALLTAGPAIVGVGLLAAAVVPNPVKGLADSFVDNVFRDTVLPKIGSVVYCDLAIAEHSGIYIGDNLIVHLDGSGEIQQVSPSEFLNRLGGFNQAMSIYVSCHDTAPVGMESIANQAKKMIGKSRNYNLIFDNCHQFTAGCITGSFANANNFLWMLKDETANKLNADTWRVWERRDGKYM